MNRDKNQQDQPGLWDETTGTGPPTERRVRQNSPRRGSSLATDAGTATQNTPPEPPEHRPTPPMEFQELWNIDQVSNYLGVPRQTIYGWRSEGKGPKGFRVGKHLRWHARTVIAWTLGLEREQ